MSIDLTGSQQAAIDALAQTQDAIAVSGKTGEGIGEWLAWLEAHRP